MIAVTVDTLQRRDTTASWEYANPVLGDKIIGYEVDGFGKPVGYKIGDGSTAWDALIYWWHAPVITRVTAGNLQPFHIINTNWKVSSVLYRNADGTIYGGATSQDTGTEILITGDDDGSGNFIDTFDVIIA